MLRQRKLVLVLGAMGVAQLSAGIFHLPGVMCPMLVRITDFPAHLSAPLGNRPVIDLATGKAAGTVGVIPVPPAGAAP